MSEREPQPDSSIRHADLWDDAADERQRLADEREGLANEREALANERERLADEQERLLDHRYARLDDEVELGTLLDDELARVEAEGNLARAEARLQRAIAERERAQAVLERQRLTAERRLADSTRTHDRVSSTEDSAGWHAERRAFVATDRERLASAREEAQDSRDELADHRERAADRRDQESRERERALVQVEVRGLGGPPAAAADRNVVRAREDLSQVRESADRQRRSTARERLRARADRVETRKNVASIMPDGCGPLLSAEFVELTRELFASRELADVVTRVLDFTLECFPEFSAAGVMVFEGRAATLRIASNEVAQHLDAFQLDAGEGPAIEALDAPEAVQAATLAPWPDLAATAAEHEVTSALAYGLSLPRDGRWVPIGVLTVYGCRVSSLDSETIDLGGILAAYLSVAAGFDRDRRDLGRREAALHRALSSRDVIGQAKGILMERQHIAAGQAFDILRNVSQRLNVRLQEVAARLAETGEIPR